MVHVSGTASTRPERYCYVKSQVWLLADRRVGDRNPRRRVGKYHCRCFSPFAANIWIDFLRGGRAVETLFLRASLERGDPVWLAAPILQEVLQGADSQQRFAKWDRALGELPMVQDAGLRELTRAAARLYARSLARVHTPQH